LSASSPESLMRQRDDRDCIRHSLQEQRGSGSKFSMICRVFYWINWVSFIPQCR
jgi:hypothetical protein